MSSTTQKSRPIIFTGESVRQILAGKKTQSRRVVKPQPPKQFSEGDCALLVNSINSRWAFSRIYVMGIIAEVYPADPLPGISCPYGDVGSLLWVKETWSPLERSGDAVDGIKFQSDGVFVEIENTADAATKWVVAANNDHSGKWRSPLFMPRWASRLTLEITSVQVERLSGISEADAIAEGCTGVQQFKDRWQIINGKKHPWASNPWVWKLTFRRVEA